VRLRPTYGFPAHGFSISADGSHRTAGQYCTCTVDPNEPEGPVNIRDDLLDFVRAHRDELTLSVYIEAAPADPAARRNWRVRLRQGLNDVRESLVQAPADEQDAFERCAAEVLGRLPNGETPAGGLGWACFASAGGEVLTVHLRDAAETQVAWGPGVRLVPFLRAADEPPALVVRIDRLHLRIHRWHEGVLEPLVSRDATLDHEPGPHMGDAARLGFHDGTRGRTRTDEDQRQRQEATDRLLAFARTQVLHLAGRTMPILIGGGAEAAARLLAHLPGAVADRAVLVADLALSADDAVTAPVIHGALQDLERTLRLRRVAELREMAHAHGRAAVGLTPARTAADLGALAELIFSERAWRQHPDEIEALVQRALAAGAEVALAPVGGDMPSDGEGVFAGLRFPLPTTR